MGGGTQDEKGSAEAWYGALGRKHTRVGRHHDDRLHQTRVNLKPAMTSALTRSSSATSSVMKKP